MSIRDVEVPILPAFNVRRREPPFRRKVSGPCGVERALAQLGEHSLVHEVDGFHRRGFVVIPFLKNSITGEWIVNKQGSSADKWGQMSAANVVTFLQKRYNEAGQDISIGTVE